MRGPVGNAAAVPLEEMTTTLSEPEGCYQNDAPAIGEMKEKISVL